MMTYERLAQILLANGVNSPAELEKVLRYVLVLRDRPLPLDCPTGGVGSNQEGAGDPGGALAVDFVGQRYKDTSTGNIWIANSTTPGDWTLEVQNYQMAWTPNNINMGSLVALNAWEDVDNLTGITSIVCSATSLEHIDIETTTNLVSLSFPNLTNTVSSGNGILFIACAALTTLSFPSLTTTPAFSITTSPLGSLSMPLLQTLGGALVISGSNLTSLTLDSLTTIGINIAVTSNSLLTSVSLAAYLPTNTKNVDFSGNALSAISVNHILARCVANAGYVNGIVSLNGGTNAAPSGQGIVDKAALIGRGVTVNTN